MKQKSRTMNIEGSRVAPARKTLKCPVKIREHEPHIDKLDQEVCDRAMGMLNSERPAYLYSNPIVTITCEKLNPQFFSSLRRYQAEWCKRAKSIFGRSPMRKSSNWSLGPGERTLSSKQRKYFKYLTRGFCFTGLLFVQGKNVPHHEWPTVE